jgi:hypothetical protein
MYDPQKQLDRQVDRALGKAKDKAVSTVVWWAIGCVVMLLLVCFVGGLFVYIGGAGLSSYMQTAGAAQRTASAWDGLSTLECTGANTMELEGITATLSDVGVRASGACNLTLRNCNLTAPTAVEVSGGAHVTIIGGTVTGSVAAIQAGGGSTVDVQGATITGPVARSGGAHVNGVP